jgi:hypothetical protein
MKYKTEDPSWVTFFPTYCEGFYIAKAGYFDERPEVVTSVTQLLVLAALPLLLTYSLWFLLLLPLLIVGWGELFIHLPIKTGLEQAESAQWGIDYHNQQLWLYLGGTPKGTSYIVKSIDLPWAWVFHERKIKLSNGVWVPIYSTSFDRPPIASQIEQQVLPDGTTAILCVVEAEYRRKWLKWATLFNKKQKSILVYLPDGLRGSYTMGKNKTPLEAFWRIQKEGNL